MHTDDTISFHERYLSIREWVERRTLEQGMVQTFAPPVPALPTPGGPRRRTRRRRPVGAARTAMPPRSYPEFRTPQLALDLR